MLVTFGLLVNFGFPEFFILVVIFSIPVFPFVLRRYKRKLGDNKVKVLLSSVIASILVSVGVVLALIAALVTWLMRAERMRL